jgi:hypothetical protein
MSPSRARVRTAHRARAHARGVGRSKLPPNEGEGERLLPVACRCVSVLLLLFLSAGPDQSQQAVTAQDVIDRSLSAQGGKENLRKIQTRVAIGKVEVLGGFVGSYRSSAKAPDKLNTSWDITVIQQQRGFDGVNGWEKLASVRELAGSDLARLKRSALFNPLLTYADTHVPMNLKGKENLDGAEVYVVEFMPNKATVDRFYFDTTTFLPIKEIRPEPFEEGAVPVTIIYGDYRKVEDIRLPFSVGEQMPDQPLSIQVEEYRLNVPVDDKDFQNPMAEHAHDPYEVSLATIPRHVYKENDGLWAQGWQRFWAIPYGPTESWLFNIVVNEKYGRQLEPLSAKLEFFSGPTKRQQLDLSQDTLRATKKFPVTRYAPQPEIFDIRHHFSEPIALGIDRIVYTLELVAPSGKRVEQTLVIPVSTYQLRKKYIFPIKGNFIVTTGHAFNELGHTYEWSQHFAYDIVGLGPHFEMFKGDGRKPEDYATWGREIIAPADGVVVYARNDVPNMAQPKDFLKLPDPQWAIGGNIILIDHGDGEVSLFAHSQYGSVRVKKGDHVKQGEVISLVGCTGAPGHPHLHYQLQAGPELFGNDGLPTEFENLVFFAGGDDDGQSKATTPKRGVYMEAK